jgi:hypothetical protein
LGQKYASELHPVSVCSANAVTGFFYPDNDELDLAPHGYIRQECRGVRRSGQEGIRTPNTAVQAQRVPISTTRPWPQSTQERGEYPVSVIAQTTGSNMMVMV